MPGGSVASSASRVVAGVLHGDLRHLGPDLLAAAEQAAALVDRGIDDTPPGVRVDGLLPHPRPRRVQPHQRRLHDVLGLGQVAGDQQRGHPHQPRPPGRHKLGELVIPLSRPSHSHQPFLVSLVGRI
jgi:hypothetical protein